MLGKLRIKVLNVYYSLVTSIAFMPALITGGFFILSLISLALFDREANLFLSEKIPALMIDNADTARAVLSAFIGGIISLTSFSFSMVMLLLSQASANFSPRLLPGLVSDTRNQVVLGVFLGSIVFMVNVLVSIEPLEGGAITSGFSVLLSITFGMLCLALFVYFIHNMSAAIQIDNILEGVYNDAKDRLKGEIEKDISNDPIALSGQRKWIVLSHENYGYFQGINKQGTLKKIQEAGLNLKLIPFKGQYVHPGQDVILADRKIDEDLAEEITDNLIFSNKDRAESNYVLGIKQITEVGVKAMSPGINDPGTALVSIDYLTHLLELRMQLSDTEVHRTEDGEYGIEMGVLDFDTIIYEALAEYRAYCKHDYSVVRKLIELLMYLGKCNAKSNDYIEVIDTQLELLRTDLCTSIENEKDRERLLIYMDR